MAEDEGAICPRLPACAISSAQGMHARVEAAAILRPPPLTVQNVSPVADGKPNGTVCPGGGMRHPPADRPKMFPQPLMGNRMERSARGEGRGTPPLTVPKCFPSG